MIIISGEEALTLKQKTRGPSHGLLDEFRNQLYIRLPLEST